MKKRLSRAFALLSMVASASSVADDVLPMVGAFYDNQLQGSAELGALYFYERVTKPYQRDDGTTDHVFDHLKFVYLDGEAGRNGSKITFGLGRHIGEGSARIGISTLKLDSSRLVGFEATATAFFLSLKAGVYKDTDSSEYEFMLGAGLSIVGGI